MKNGKKSIFLCLFTRSQRDSNWVKNPKRRRRTNVSCWLFKKYLSSGKKMRCCNKMRDSKFQIGSCDCQTFAIIYYLCLVCLSCDWTRQALLFSSFQLWKTFFRETRKWNKKKTLKNLLTHVFWVYTMILMDDKMLSNQQRILLASLYVIITTNTRTNTTN